MTEKFKEMDYKTREVRIRIMRKEVVGCVNTVVGEIFY